MVDATGQYIQQIKEIPILRELYKACDWSFNNSMNLVGKINPEWETYLRANQGIVAFYFGFLAPYATVRVIENAPKWFFKKIGKENWIENYDNLLTHVESIGYGINISIPFLIQIFNPGGLQGLFEDHPVFSPGLIGLIGGSSVAVAQERSRRKNRKIKQLENIIK